MFRFFRSYSEIKICHTTNGVERKRAVAVSATALRFGQLLLCSVNGALSAILALALELDGTVNQSEQGVILADTNVDTGMDDTLFALVDGTVKFERKGKDRRQCSVYAEQ